MTRYLTCLLCSLLRYQVGHSKRNSISPHTHVLFSSKCSMRHFSYENAILSKFSLNQNFNMIWHLISMLAHGSDKVDFLQSSSTFLRKCLCTHLNPRLAFQTKKTIVIPFHSSRLPPTKTMLNYSLLWVGCQERQPHKIFRFCDKVTW